MSRVTRRRRTCNLKYDGDIWIQGGIILSAVRVQTDRSNTPDGPALSLLQMGRFSTGRDILGGLG